MASLLCVTVNLSDEDFETLFTCITVSLQCEFMSFRVIVCAINGYILRISPHSGSFHVFYNDCVS